MLDWMEGESNEIDELFGRSTPRRTPRRRSRGCPRPFFPPPTATTPDGLCAWGVGYRRNAVDAYRHGIFFPGRCGRTIDRVVVARSAGRHRARRLHISRRLQRTLRSGKFASRDDRDFCGVINGWQQLATGKMALAVAANDLGLSRDA